MLKADNQEDAARWVKGLQARQHRPEGTPSEIFSMHSERMDAESDVSSEYGRRHRTTSSDSGSHRSSFSLSYVETQNPVVPNAAAIARLSLSHADAPNFVAARASFPHAEVQNSLAPEAFASTVSNPIINMNEPVKRSAVNTQVAAKTVEDEVVTSAQCCAPCGTM